MDRVYCNVFSSIQVNACKMSKISDKMKDKQIFNNTAEALDPGQLFYMPLTFL